MCVILISYRNDIGSNSRKIPWIWYGMEFIYFKTGLVFKKRINSNKKKRWQFFFLAKPAYIIFFSQSCQFYQVFILFATYNIQINYFTKNLFHLLSSMLYFYTLQVLHKSFFGRPIILHYNPNVFKFHTKTFSASASYIYGIIRL